MTGAREQGREEAQKRGQQAGSHGAEDVKKSDNLLRKIAAGSLDLAVRGLQEEFPWGGVEPDSSGPSRR